MSHSLIRGNKFLFGISAFSMTEKHQNLITLNQTTFSQNTIRDNGNLFRMEDSKPCQSTVAFGHVKVVSTLSATNATFTKDEPLIRISKYISLHFILIQLVISTTTHIPTSWRSKNHRLIAPLKIPQSFAHQEWRWNLAILRIMMNSERFEYGVNFVMLDHWALKLAILHCIFRTEITNKFSIIKLKLEFVHIAL